MSQLSQLLPHFAAVLIGGLATSLGVSIFARRPSGTRLLAKARWWGVTLYSLAAMGGVVAGFMWLNARMGDPEAAGRLLESPIVFLLFGLIIGAPFSLPVVLAAWNDSRPSKLAARKGKKERVTKADRLEFARTLEKQIADFAEDEREVTCSLRGDDGTILYFDGKLTRAEGDRLAAALKDDLVQLGFTRLEGDRWWAKVAQPPAPPLRTGEDG